MPTDESFCSQLLDLLVAVENESSTSVFGVKLNTLLMFSVTALITYFISFSRFSCCISAMSPVLLWLHPPTASALHPDSCTATRHSQPLIVAISNRRNNGTRKQWERLQLTQYTSGQQQRNRREARFSHRSHREMRCGPSKCGVKGLVCQSWQAGRQAGVHIDQPRVCNNAWHQYSTFTYSLNFLL